MQDQMAIVSACVLSGIIVAKLCSQMNADDSVELDDDMAEESNNHILLVDPLPDVRKPLYYMYCMGVNELN